MDELNMQVSLSQRQPGVGVVSQEVLQVFTGHRWRWAIWSQVSRLAGNQSNRWGDRESIFPFTDLYICPAAH